MERILRLLKPLAGLITLAVSGLIMWSYTEYMMPLSVVYVVGFATVMSYVASSSIMYYWLDADAVVQEVISVYHAAYTLLSSYVLFIVGGYVHPTAGVLSAAPFAYFFPATHVKCSVDTSKHEEHLIPACTLLITLIGVIAVAYLV